MASIAGMATAKSPKAARRAPATPADNTAAIAAQFGVSMKALRLYESLGMLKPPRTQAGWRVYGPAEIQRLHAILSLKQLGLPLQRIATLMEGGASDLNALLALQEQVLKQTSRDTEHALRLVQVARARVRASKNLSADEFAALVHGISKMTFRSTPELEALAERIYTPDQLSQIRSREFDAKEAVRLSKGWARVHADIGAMLPGGDPASRKGLAIARRAVGLMRSMTRGDRELWNSSARFYQAAVADPRMSQQLPMSKAHYEFMGKAMAELKRRGELKP